LEQVQQGVIYRSRWHDSSTVTVKPLASPALSGGLGTHSVCQRLRTKLCRGMLSTLHKQAQTGTEAGTRGAPVARRWRLRRRARVEPLSRQRLRRRHGRRAGARSALQARIGQPRLSRLSLLAAPRSSAAVRVGRPARYRRSNSVTAATSRGVCMGRRRGRVGRPGIRRRRASARAGRARRAGRPGRLARRGGRGRGLL